MSGTSFVRPPDNTNLIYGLWFQRLHQPATSLPCCDIPDCRQTAFRIVDNHYEAVVEGKWLAVPSETVVDRADNPMGTCGGLLAAVAGDIVLRESSGELEGEVA
jgi:hypothetical protein